MKPLDAMFRCDPAFKKIEKKAGKKSEKPKEEKKMEPVPVMTVSVVFRKDEEGLYAMIGGRRARVSASSENTVHEGQRWKCMIDRRERFKPELIPTELVSEKPKEESVSIDCLVHEAEEQSVSTEPVEIDDTKQLEEIETLKDVNAELRRKLGVAEEYKILCERKDEVIKVLDRKVKSLSVQVNVLNDKTSQSNIRILESKIEDLTDGIESRECEIAMLREKLRELGADDLKVVPRLPPVMKAIKNGTTLRFKDSVKDGRYSVYVNSRGHRLLIIPDVNGVVCCDGGEMHLACIGLTWIGGDTGPRQVAITSMEDGYEVILT